MDMPGTPLETAFLSAVKRSMSSMSKSYTLGCSWAAFRTWNAKWDSLTFKNRMLVRSFVQREINTSDALEVVMQANGA